MRFGGCVFTTSGLRFGGPILTGADMFWPVLLFLSMFGGGALFRLSSGGFSMSCPAPVRVVRSTSFLGLSKNLAQRLLVRPATLESAAIIGERCSRHTSAKRTETVDTLHVPFRLVPPAKPQSYTSDLF